MAVYPEPIEDLIESLCRMPGIGEKSALRLVMHMLEMPEKHLRDLSKRIAELQERIKLCSICYTLTESQPCSICSDPGREASMVCVVEAPADLLALEQSGCYRGRYHVLHGALSPLDNVGPEDLKIQELFARLDREDIKEVILATNPTARGDATASYLLDRLKTLDVAVTRIAFGIPVGGDLKYADAVTLRRALESRHTL